MTVDIASTKKSSRKTGVASAGAAFGRAPTAGFFNRHQARSKMKSTSVLDRRSPPAAAEVAFCAIPTEMSPTLRAESSSDRWDDTIVRRNKTAYLSRKIAGPVRVAEEAVQA